MENQNQLNISLDQTQEMICEKCNNNTFIDIFFIRRVPGILSGSPQDSFIPAPSFACLKCKHVNEEFIPKEK